MLFVQRGVTGFSDRQIERRIYSMRGERIMLDSDLAMLYEVTTFHLNRAVKRNLARFPADFMFKLSKKELDNLICQFGISSLSRHGGRRHFPYAFTEQGVAGLSGVLKSRRAAVVHVSIMRAFVRMRRMLSEHKELGRKLDALEKKFDARFKIVFKVIRKLMAPPLERRHRIGFGN